VSVAEILAGCPVVPVVAIDRAEDAVPLARALAAGGLTTIEVTLRTPVALESITAIAAEVPEIRVGAGTLRDAAQVEAALAAGAEFLVTPALTPGLLDALVAAPVPAVPGIATPSEAAAALDAGLRELKLFPAGALGATALLRALAGPYPEARFVPTGGIDAAGAPDYLALANVLAVGGSWVSAAAPDWDAVTAAARAAAALGGLPA
jgi:2-dehydro-3-deoxyphosphogluconate aldolase / (4S)-4-hydroxy-2-oxoglutarate aldolase